MKTGKRIWSLLLALILVVSLMGGAFVTSAADAVTITPDATVGGETITLTATGVDDEFTYFTGYGTSYALWFDHDGTFCFDKDVSLSYQGQVKAELTAGEVYKIADGYTEVYVALDDGTNLMILDKDDPGNFGPYPADTPLTEFPGTVSAGAPAAEEPAEEEPTEEPAEEQPAEEEPAEEQPAEEEPAEEQPAASEDAVVYVTISVAGEIVAPSVPVLVSDLNADGGFDVDEVLKCAHDQLYPGGAEAGYASSVGDWGLGMDMLWGDTSYAFSYYVNNTMAWGLSDPVQAGGSVYAYVYTDKEFYSDIYAYFDQTDAVTEDGTLTLTLFAGSFDENWDVVFAPCAGAIITCNGTATEYVTDENGQVTVTFDENGSYLISAVGADEYTILVPAICKVTVDKAAAPAEEPAPTEATIPDIDPGHAEGVTTYTVQEGDTIRSIAKAFYGTIFKWRWIYEANYESMTGTDMIYVGQVLQIP